MERQRLADRQWLQWGPYLAERAWGTVREDYSEGGGAWEYLPHDHARSRVYRWNEDGLAGVCDLEQTFCFALAFWNGRDPIIKERLFGLTGNEGNHGEDAKEYWWYTDSTPTHSWMSWRYHYPQQEFPYSELVAVNRQLDRSEPEYELDDTGVFAEDRYWAITADYAKASPTDLCVLITVANRGPDEETLHVLPTLWFRKQDRTLQADGPVLRAGDLTLSGLGTPATLVCDNETNAQRLWGQPNKSAYPKDGINDHLIHGTPTVNLAGTGTKGSLHYVVTVPPGQSVQLRVRLTEGPALGEFDEVVSARKREADEYFAELIPLSIPEEERAVARAAVAGLMWGKQFYHYDVARWMEGRPNARNSAWRHLSAHDVISMPDPWEYPWFAAWDLAFHCVALARVDPEFAKQQILLLLSDWYLHPNGQVPAYEWAFGDVNPPMHAWAALKVFEADGGTDYDFLERAMHKLLLNFTWWVNQKDTEGNNLFEGGFLGLDNIGPFDRSAPLPVDGVLEQSDGTAWMALYSLNMLEISLVLATHDHVWADITTKFLEHFAHIGYSASGAASDENDLWDDTEGFFYDAIRLRDGTRIPIRVRSVVGLLPLCATTMISAEALATLPEAGARLQWLLRHNPEFTELLGQGHVVYGHRLLSVVGEDRMRTLLADIADEEEFLSPHGLRSMSRKHLAAPYSVLLGGQEFTVGYEPAESRSGTFGGNSNWRGPVWFPVNYLLIEAMRHYGSFYRDTLTVEYPARSGQQRTLTEIADDLSVRLVKLFLPGEDGIRPIWNDEPFIRDHPDWRDLLVFPEYFHGDTGAALGAWHQCGWTGLVLNLILSRQR